MLSTKDFRQIVSELLDELPEAFFRELSGGVLVSEAASVPDYAEDGELYTLGVYKVFSGVRQIILYKGSFDRVHPGADANKAKALLRNVLRHEFRHHLEALGGVPFADSLKARDERDKRAYLAGRANRGADDAASAASPPSKDGAQ